MLRNPDGEIEQIRSEVDLVRLVQDSGVELNRVGHELLGRCLFHSPDTTPSLSVNPDKGVWRCFACGVGGSSFDWVMKRDRVSFSHAKAILRARLGDGLVVSRKVSRDLPQVLKPTAEDRERLRWVVTKYHELLLTGTTPATAYLEKRGIKDDEAVRTFKLGYADRTLGYGLPPKSRTREDDPRRLLERIGILRESGHEHFAGSLVIPVIDAGDDVREVYGRKVRDDLRPGTPKHLFLDSGKRVCPNRGVWNWQGLDDQEEVILCEALIDALTFWCAGFRNVTSAYGCDVFPEQHAQAFKHCDVKRVLIAFDRDEAGDRGAAAVAAKLGAMGIGCFRVHFPHHMDANEYALKLTPAAKSLALVLENATWMGQGPPPSRSMEIPAMRATETIAITAEPAQPEVVDVPAPVEERRAAEGEDEAPIADETQVALEGAAYVAEGCEAAAIESTVDATPNPAPLSAALPVAAALVAKSDVVANVSGEEVTIDIGGRHYRVRGLGKNMSYDLLRVNVLVSRGDAFHVDTFDLYAARCRQVFVRQAAQELGVKEDVIKKDVGRVLLALEALQDEQIKKSLAPQEKPVVLTEEERSAALARLKSPNLLNELADDLEHLGLVGELVNKKVCLLAAVSRKQPRPLAIMVQSSSASGKSTLMDRILDSMPDEDCIQYSAMTGQSLFYMGEKNLRHKILAIAEEEGATRASYALKLLQSEGQVSIASTGKDPATGRLLTHEYQVKGPVMLFLTTTAVELDEELLNRCIVLSVDEGREQTRAIHRLQRHQETIEGIVAEEERDELQKLLKNMQRLLQPVKVHNPFAPYLTFLDKETQARRDNPKYLGLIRAVALLHQYQRQRKTMVHKGRRIEYIDVTLEDVAVANELANEVLGQSLKDLPEQTEQLLYLIEKMVAESCEAQEMERKDYLFSRRDIREYVGWKDGRLKKHLRKLEELEYLVIHRAGSRFLYELVYDGRGKDGSRFLPGLLDVEELRANAYDGDRSRGNGHRSRSEEQKSRSGHPEVTGVARGWHGGSIGLKPANGNGSRGSEAGNGENALGGQTIESSQLPPGRNGDELGEAV